MKRLPAWTDRFVTPFIMTMLMTAIVSGISTFRVAGFEGLREHWLSSWLWSWLVAFPTLVLILPLVRYLAGLFVETPTSQK